MSSFKGYAVFVYKKLGFMTETGTLVDGSQLGGGGGGAGAVSFIEGSGGRGGR